MGIIGPSVLVNHFLVLSLLLYVAMGADTDCERDTTVYHFVLNTFLDLLPQPAIDKILLGYVNLTNEDPRVKHFYWGKDLGPKVENRTEGYDYGYMTTLCSEEETIAYLKDDRTVRFGREFFGASKKAIAINYMHNYTYEGKGPGPCRCARVGCDPPPKIPIP
ncbi:hypothetical protein Tsubulata_029187 [Turnera subulata]|uniref:Stress-response A/B barrel domain-containing protein n=1 Tax=Turnera subulata TaxID=218843 RepID=A0A9Q0FJY0_9ROSI|nr:hypothetical protein Tsubulata_029187 [Turnera subulata]